MNRFVPLLTLAAIAGPVTACDEPAPYRGPKAEAAPALAAAPVERAQPIRWNDLEKVFEFDGRPLEAERLWAFEDGPEGFTMSGGTVELVPGSGLKIVEHSVDPILRSPAGLGLDGSAATMVLVRLTRGGAGESWSGAMHYATAAHGESAGFMAMPVQGAAPAINETVILVYDMTRLKRGGADWTRSKVDQLRFDFEDLPGGEFLVRQVAVVRAPDQALAD